ncbi:MAG: GAF domain-containing sensor histidine kinase [Chloroflexi bacterium]|nr:GAF domain-containing sensor histidine kinase [Chloroflexota bacterium]
MVEAPPYEYGTGVIMINEDSLGAGKDVDLRRLLLIAILVPTAFVVGVILVSFVPHRAGLLTHTQEHVALAATMVAGIIPFSFFMLGVFRRIERRILRQNLELSRRTREMEALLKVGRAVEASLELDRVLPAALEAVLDATSAEAAEVWLVDKQQGAVLLRHHAGAARDAFMEVTRFGMGESYPGMVAQTGQPIMVHSLPNDPISQRPRVQAAGFQTLYAVPLRRSGSTIGVLGVAARSAQALTSQDELRLLELMAEHIATAVENAQLHEEVRTLATVAERERLAREMHDGLAQVLGYVNTKAQAVQELLKAGQVEAAVGQMEQLEAAARDTYDDVRETILALGANGRKRPLLQSLRDYVHRFEELSGLPTEMEAEGDLYQFNPSVEVQVLRIVQEALANVRKHAQATRASVLLYCGASGCRLVVEDNGRGFDPAHVTRGPWPHLGLQSMQERAAAIGARFTLDTAPGRGTRVILDLPKVAQ